MSAKLAGYKEWSDRLKATPRERKTITARLIKVSIPRGKAQLSIDSTPWAIVYVDGQHVGTTPVVGHAISAGPHKVRLVNNQIHSSRTIKIEAKPGGNIRKTVKFLKGTLSVNAKPWAHVNIHGKRIGTTPFEPLELFEGSYKVVLENPTLGRSLERQVKIKPGEKTVLTVNFLE